MSPWQPRNGSGTEMAPFTPAHEVLSMYSVSELFPSMGLRLELFCVCSIQIVYSWDLKRQTRPQTLTTNVASPVPLSVVVLSV